MLTVIPAVRRRACLPALAVCMIVLSACGVLGGSSPQAAEAVANVNGLARVQSAAGAVDFQITSGLSGEYLPGVRVRVAVVGRTRLMLAEDPTNVYLPVAVPLAGEATVRRLVMPPKTVLNYNIATAAGPLDLGDLEPLGTLSEADLRARLSAGPDRAVLIYLYNPVRPLALTGAALEAYAVPFDNVMVLKASGEPADAELALLIVGLSREAYAAWEHRNVDRYLAGRIGAPPDVDLYSDLAFLWAYPVFEVSPPDAALSLGEGNMVTLRVSWRSRNPDPPAPWSLFVSVDNPAVTVVPEAFGLGPDQPPQEITLTVNRQGLAVGDYSVRVYIQPFSEVFGLIQQGVERTLTFTVAAAPPTPTPGPSVSSLYVAPSAPRQGDMLSIAAEGFTPREPVLVEFTGAEYTFRDALPVADAGGAFTYQIDLTSVPPGEYTLRLTGTQSAVTGIRTISVGVRVADAIVNTDELNVRYGPGYDYPVLEVLVRGDQLEVIGTNADDSWIEVITATGVRGWVVTDLVTLNIDLSTVPWNPNVP